MALIDRLIGPALGRYMEKLTQSIGGQMTNSGQMVNEDSAYQLVPFRAAINVLSSDVSTLPLKLYQREGRGRSEATTHPLYDCLHFEPNSRMNSFEWRESMMVSLLTWGNSYSWIQRDGAGRTMGLWPLRPDRMTAYLDTDGTVYYEYKPVSDNIEAQVFTSHDVLHVKGMSRDGLVGRTPLYDFVQKLGEIKAMERFSQSFYGNGMKRSAVLRHPSSIGDKALEHLKASLVDQRGTDAAWKTLILEEGMEFSELSFAPEDAQLLDTRRFGVEDVCRIYNLPAYKMRINVPGAVSYASVDAQSVDYLVSTLTPWLVRIEAAVARACLTRDERKAGLFVEHNTRALLRSDLKSQAEALGIQRDKTLITINEARDFLGMNPHPDSRADDLFAPTYVQSTAGDMASPAE